MGVPSYFAYLIRNHKEMLIKLVGFKKRARKKPFIIQDIITNDKFVCSESMAVQLFRANS